MKTIGAVGRLLTILVGVVAVSSLVQRGINVGLQDWQSATIDSYRSFTRALTQTLEWILTLLGWEIELPDWAGDYAALHGLAVGAVFRAGDLRGMADFGDPFLWRILPDGGGGQYRFAVILIMASLLPLAFIPYLLWFRIFVLKHYLDHGSHTDESDWSREITLSMVSGFILVPLGALLFFVIGSLPNVL